MENGEEMHTDGPPCAGTMKCIDDMTDAEVQEYLRSQGYDIDALNERISAFAETLIDKYGNKLEGMARVARIRELAAECVANATTEYDALRNALAHGVEKCGIIAREISSPPNVKDETWR